MTIEFFKRWGSALALALGTMTFGQPALAQAAASDPNKPVKLLVSFPPGGFADLVGRGLAQALSQLWGQPVVVDNKPGGASILATELAAKAPPDGPSRPTQVPTSPTFPTKAVLPPCRPCCPARCRPRSRACRPPCRM